MFTAIVIIGLAVKVVAVVLGSLGLAVIGGVLIISCLPSPMTQQLYNRFIKPKDRKS